MLYSMTGYGKAEGLLSEGRHLIVEIKSLNGKNFDLNNRFPSAFRSCEARVRKLLQELLFRGTIDISLTLKQNGDTKPLFVNKEVAHYYFHSMKEIAEELSLTVSGDQMLQTLMGLPEVVTSDTENVAESEWVLLEKSICAAAESLIQYRKTEGEAIEADLLKRIRNIEHLLTSIVPLEKDRIGKITQRIEGTLKEIGGKVMVDKNRFEQELIYYLEKIDFSEEKQRLAAHCSYFKKLTDDGTESGMGKKLGFVLQEMGREINTLGSKANDAEIQKVVVNMKDELEKVKEQILNVL